MRQVLVALLGAAAVAVLAAVLWQTLEAPVAVRDDAPPTAPTADTSDARTPLTLELSRQLAQPP
ncbi:MAG: hypothetical protein AAGD86_02645, partial [Pseudomonadota bacterium]